MPGESRFRCLVFSLCPLVLATSAWSSQRPPLLHAPYLSYDTGPSPGRLILADVDGDGRDDIITLNHGDNTVTVLLSLGDGTFRSRVDSPAGPGGGRRRSCPGLFQPIRSGTCTSSCAALRPERLSE